MSFITVHDITSNPVLVPVGPVAIGPKALLLQASLRPSD